MERWLSQLLFCFFLVSLLSAFVGIGWLLTKQIFKNPNQKADEDKALLKKLLEDFGLDIPSELDEAHSSVIKSVKTP